jgi:hypothetical protein
MNEYMTVKEIAIEVGLSTQSIRKRLNNINNNELLLHKTSNGEYKIHRLLLPKFAAIKMSKEFSYSLDFDKGYTDNDIHNVMNYILSLLNDFEITIQYVIEQKKKDNTPHIHGIIKGITKTNFIKYVHNGVINKSFMIKPMYDVKGWLNYITKESKEIITISNIKII